MCTEAKLKYNNEIFLRTEIVSICNGIDKYDITIFIWKHEFEQYQCIRNHNPMWT